MQVFKLAILGIAAMSVSACGGGGSSTTSLSTTPQAVTPPAAPVSQVKISGQVSYDRVPHTFESGLDYANTISLPIRGAVVEAIDANGQVLASTISAPDGSYSLSVNSGTQARLQVKAQLLSSGSQQWNFQVTDNTQGNALYALQGSLASTGSSDEQTRDIHAPHGWTGQSYGAARSAAPFAILDSVYTATQTFAAIDPDIKFPALELRWSAENSATIGDRSLGQIGTSAYFPNEDGGVIYVLGQENRDTDEYDPHVILHEWGHYFEHKMSRTDSIGGYHSLNDRLDARVAFSEGWSNALAAILIGDPIYRDSSGAQQSSGFLYNLESSAVVNPGWFNEASIGSIIYDVYDDASDGFDGISAGLGPLYDVLRSGSYKDSTVFTTVFALADGLRSGGQIDSAELDRLLTSHGISGNGPNGNGESNSGAIRSALPVYKEVVPNGAPIELCSIDDAGVFNKLGNRDFIFFDLATDANVEISVSKTSGAEDRDPDFNIWKSDQRLHTSDSEIVDRESFKGALSAGAYILETYDYKNISGAAAERGDSCYELSLREQ